MLGEAHGQGGSGYSGAADQHVRNLAQQVTPMSAAGPEQAMSTSLQLVLAGREDRFPAVTAAQASDSRDQALDFGLARILDGVGVLIEGR
ncbi:MAG TPA: hypothetical protein VN408_40265 [Actinoplanes sp.]|nr:hypothetical protein [Actinoplanes sp.]